MIPNAQVPTEKRDKLDFIKIKNLCLKGCHQGSAKTTNSMGKIFADHISDKVVVSRIYKQFWNFNNKKKNNLIKTWAKDLNRHFSDEDTVNQ